MPLREARYADLLPASKIFAPAFFDHYLLGDLFHPHRHEYPDDLYLYHLRSLRKAYFQPDENAVVVTYAIDPATGKDDRVTGVATWERKHANDYVAKPSLISKASKWAVEWYNYLENYIYPNRAIDPSGFEVLGSQRRFIQHHWTGTRAEGWSLSCIAVAPAYEGQGYGRQLVEWGLRRSREDKVVSSLICAPGKEGFYRACGFLEVGTTNDEGGEENYFATKGCPGSVIFFCDNGIEPTGIESYKPQ